MIDDLIFFGIDHTIPEEKGISFLFRMFKAYSRNWKRMLEPLKKMNLSGSLGKNKTYTCGGEIPAHLRKSRRKKK